MALGEAGRFEDAGWVLSFHRADGARCIQGSFPGIRKRPSVSVLFPRAFLRAPVDSSGLDAPPSERHPGGNPGKVVVHAAARVRRYLDAIAPIRRDDGAASPSLLPLLSPARLTSPRGHCHHRR